MVAAAAGFGGLVVLVLVVLLFVVLFVVVGVLVLVVLVPGCCLLWYVYSNNTPMHNTRTSVCPSATASLRRPFDPDASFESNKKKPYHPNISSYFLPLAAYHGWVIIVLSVVLRSTRPFSSTHAHARFS